ncbi:hypothetical protein NL108_017422, partial [Boleophthalmus pectinirostris]
VSVDSSKELSVWMDTLSSSISSSLGSSQVALRLWDQNPSTKLCADCGAANPEWASANLLLVLCHTCAGVHRSLGKVSKVKSLTMDNKVWTEALIQLFVSLGNQTANQIWAPVVPATEQLSPDSSDEARSKFIHDKYAKGRYRRLHALSSSQDLMDQEEEELHGKLEDDRFLFSLENDSAAYDVLDLREVHAVFLHSGNSPQFQIHTLNGTLVCAADSTQELLSHYYHILKVILPSGVSDAEVGGALAVSKVCVVEMGVRSSQSDAWILLWVGGVSLHQKQSCLQLHPITRHGESVQSHATVSLSNHTPRMSFRFEDNLSCSSWFSHLCSAFNAQQANQSPAVKPGTNPIAAPYPAANQNAGSSPRANQSGGLYPVKSVKGRVPVSIERCISHITAHGLKVEGVYRRSGLTNKVNRLVEALMRSPGSAPLESDEQGVLDAATALKRIVRQMTGLVPEHHMPQWSQAAVISNERARFAAYKQLLRDLPDDNRATLNALFAHFY